METFFEESKYGKYEKYKNLSELADLPKDCLPLPKIKEPFLWRAKHFPFDQNGNITENLTNKTMVLLCERNPENKHDLHYRIGKLARIKTTSITLNCKFLRKATIHIGDFSSAKVKNPYQWIEKNSQMKIDFKFIVFIVILEKIDIQLIKKYFSPFKLIQKGTRLFHCSFKELEEKNWMDFNFSKKDAKLGTNLYTFELKKDIFVPDIINEELMNAFLLNSFGNVNELITFDNSKDMESHELRYQIYSKVDQLYGTFSTIDQYVLDQVDDYEKGGLMYKSSIIVDKLLLLNPKEWTQFISHESIVLKNQEDIGWFV